MVFIFAAWLRCLPQSLHTWGTSLRPRKRRFGQSRELGTGRGTWGTPTAPQALASLHHTAALRFLMSQMFWLQVSRCWTVSRLYIRRRKNHRNHETINSFIHPQLDDMTIVVPLLGLKCSTCAHRLRA